MIHAIKSLTIKKLIFYVCNCATCLAIVAISNQNIFSH